MLSSLTDAASSIGAAASSAKDKVLGVETPPEPPTCAQQYCGWLELSLMQRMTAGLILGSLSFVCFFVIYSSLGPKLPWFS